MTDPQVSPTPVSFGMNSGRKLDPTKSPLAHILVKLDRRSSEVAETCNINRRTMDDYVAARKRIIPKHLLALSQTLGVDQKLLDYIPPYVPPIDYNYEIRRAFSRVMLGEDPQTVVDEWRHNYSQFPVLKAAMKLFIDIRDGKLEGVLHSPLLLPDDFKRTVG